MRRWLVALAFALWVPLVSACTDSQLGWYLGMKAQGGDSAALAEQVAHDYLEAKAFWTAGRPCEQWYDTAMEAGWRPEQWPVLSRVMYGESNCIPTADNPTSSALGLMQHLRRWADNCGVPYESFVVPSVSLECALKTYEAQGWEAWEAY